MKRRNSGQAILCAVIFLFLLAAGCGEKGDPIPPRLILPPPVADLAAIPVPGGIRLSWTMPGPEFGIGKIRILRSELLVAGESCPGCPREFILIAEPSPGDLQKVRGSTRSYYLDDRVKGGMLYTYKVVLCDTSGYCGPESNMAEWKYRGTEIRRPEIKLEEEAGIPQKK